MHRASHWLQSPRLVTSQSADPRRLERLWRVRKAHRSIDAVLQPDEAGGAEIQFFYDDELLYRRTWETRELALKEATIRLRELQRAGWTPHW